MMSSKSIVSQAKSTNGFSKRSKGATSTSCGVKPTLAYTKTKRSSIESDMFYTVATTDQVRLRRGLGLLIQANQSSKWLDAPKTETLMRVDGETLGLRPMILEAVRKYHTQMEGDWLVSSTDYNHQS